MADQSKKEKFNYLSLDNREAQIYLIERLNAVQRNMDLLARNNEQIFASQNSTITVGNHGNREITDENFARGRQNNTPTTSSGNLGEK